MGKIKRSDFGVFVSQLLMGLAFIGLGIFLVTRASFMWSLVYIVLIAVLWLSGAVFLYRVVRYRHMADFFKTLGSVVAALVFQTSSELHVEFFALIFGLWALFNAFVHGLEIYLAIREKESNSFLTFVYFIFDLGFGLLLVFNGYNNRNLVNYQIGYYLIVYGLVQIISGFVYLMNGSSNIRMSAPVFFSTLLPPVIVDRIPKLKKKHPEVFKTEVIETRGNFVSVYIHIRNTGYNRLGHVDIGYNGAIYSYGAHDPFNRAISSLFGAGVMIVGLEKDFVQFAVDSDSSVYRYKIRISDAQAIQIEQRISSLLKDCYVYDFPYWDDPTGENYLSRLKMYTPSVTYYKFNSEPFKTYNLFTKNCVLIADRILQTTGLKLFQLSGIITPGTYYAFLEDLRSAQDSIIVESCTYTRK